MTNRLKRRADRMVILISTGRMPWVKVGALAAQLAVFILGGFWLASEWIDGWLWKLAAYAVIGLVSAGWYDRRLDRILETA